MAEAENTAKEAENRAPPGRFEHPAVDLEDRHQPGDSPVAAGTYLPAGNDCSAIAAEYRREHQRKLAAGVWPEDWQPEHEGYYYAGGGW